MLVCRNKTPTKMRMWYGISDGVGGGTILQNFKELAMVICYEQWFKGDKMSSNTGSNKIFDLYYGITDSNVSDGIISKV